MRTPCAYNLTRRETHYRHETFSAGLRATGYDVRVGMPGYINPGDVVLAWNRYGSIHETATRIERVGGIFVCAENGYLRGPKDGGDYYALARHAHNGAGEWSVGGPERLDALGVDLAPWWADGGHVLICPNRSFGMPGMIMPSDWAATTAKRLAKLTRREIRIRPHPGNNPPKKPLTADLAGCWAVVIWSSSAGVHALAEGIPVFQEAPHWICTSAASLNLKMIEDPAMDDFRRLRSFERLAWAQWSLAEIGSGEAFGNLLRPAGQGKVAASA